MFCRQLIHLSRVRTALSKPCVTFLPRVYHCSESGGGISLDERNQTGDGANDISSAHPAVSTITGVNEGADLSNFLYPPTYNARERRIAACLEKMLFSPNEIRRIIAYYRDRDSIYTVDAKVIQPAFEFWMSAVKPPKSAADLPEELIKKAATDRASVRPFYKIASTKSEANLKSGDEVDPEEETSFEYDFRKAETRAILARNPLLLLIDPSAMNRRLQQINELGIFSGKNDVWRVFHHAPVAFFLQDWAEFLRKYFYLQHRVLEWYIDKHHDPFPTPHPAIKSARVFDLPYHVIKARFEFAIKSGLKSPIILSKFKPDPINLTLDDIFVSPIEEFLKRITPGLSEEEYNVYEKYIEDREDPEDKMIKEMAELQAHCNYDPASMNTELAKRIAGHFLEQSISGHKEPLESMIGARQAKNQQNAADDDDDDDDWKEEAHDPLKALKDQLLLKRVLHDKKRSRRIKERDLARLRLAFPGTKPYPGGDEESNQSVDTRPFIDLSKRRR